MTTTNTTRVSLRDISEAAFRGLTAHGASHGEARMASRMVLQAELMGGGGLAALRDDLAGQPWNRTPVEVSAAPLGTADGAGKFVLRSPDGNRLLREAPLAVELVASGGDAHAVGVPTDVAGTALLDAVSLEIAEASGTGVAVIICPSPQPGAETAPGGSSEGSVPETGQLRWARPDGSMGVGTIKSLPIAWQHLLDGPGVLALRDTEALGDVELSWISAEDRAGIRAQAASGGVPVDTDLWQTVYGAARRYLVPERP
ncbi:MAG: hypothetical protein ABIZ07_00195 [Dermatophilaceae bacterium]